MSLRRSLVQLAGLPDGLLQFVAALHALAPEDMPALRLEEERRRRQKWALGSLIATALVLVLSGLSLSLVNALNRAQSLQYAAEARNALPRRIDLALARAAEAQAKRDTPQARSALLAAFRASPSLAGILPTPGIASAAAVAPDRERLALADDGKVRFWNLRTLERLPGVWEPGSGRVERLEFSLDGRFVVALQERRLRGYDLGAQRGFSPGGDVTNVVAVAFESQTGDLVAADAAARVYWWEVARLADTGEPTIHTNRLGTELANLMFGPNGDSLAGLPPHSSQHRFVDWRGPDALPRGYPRPGRSCGI